MEVEAMTLGGAITRMVVPDKDGIGKDVLLGFDTLEEYARPMNPGFGAVIGRSAGIISNPIIAIDNKKYPLTKNLDHKYHFNGGVNGFNKFVWSPHVDGNKVSMSYYSKALDEGYPGDLVVSISYELTPKNDFVIEMKACVSEPSLCNLTHKLPMNLAGHAGGASQIKTHNFVLNADNVLDYKPGTIIPTGILKKVSGTNYDLSHSTPVGDLLKKWGQEPFNSTYCINRASKQALCTAARIHHPKSGRLLEILTNQPTIQLDFGHEFPSCTVPLEQRLNGKSQVRYIKNGAFTIQPQGYPDSINQKDFPKSILLPGQIYSHVIIYQFRALKKKQKDICDESEETCARKMRGDISTQKPRCDCNECKIHCK